MRSKVDAKIDVLVIGKEAKMPWRTVTIVSVYGFAFSQATSAVTILVTHPRVSLGDSSDLAATLHLILAALCAILAQLMK